MRNAIAFAIALLLALPATAGVIGWPADRVNFDDGETAEEKHKCTAAEFYGTYPGGALNDTTPFPANTFFSLNYLNSSSFEQTGSDPLDEWSEAGGAGTNSMTWQYDAADDASALITMECHITINPQTAGNWIVKVQIAKVDDGILPIADGDELDPGLYDLVSFLLPEVLYARATFTVSDEQYIGLGIEATVTAGTFKSLGYACSIRALDCQ
jgi:hypothetical protein